MGEIVWAAGAVHAPQLLTRPPQEDQAQLQAGIDALGVLGQELDATEPDVLLLIGIDHVETFFPGSVPPFAVITGQTATAEFAGREWNVPIHHEMAQAILDGLIEEGIDLSYAHEGLLGHAFATPLEYIHQGRSIPIVPMFVNVYLPPLPTTRRCLQVGEALRKVIDSRPEKVAILASGGLSHYPGTWKYFFPEYEFDHWVIQELEEGRPESLLDLTGEQLDEVGNTELLPWVIMFGATGKQRGELLSYQPTSHHGHGVMRFIPDRGGRGQEHREIPKFGGFEFKGQGYEFYQYPSLETYPLNKALFDLRRDEVLLNRFVRDMGGVAAELGVTGVQAEALKTVSTDALAKAGAHGILAITTTLVIQRAARAAGIAIESVA